jgi:hypothetical protein
VLFPGRHLLDPTHTFVKSVSMDLDEVDLGPKKIVTIKNGTPDYLDMRTLLLLD